MHYCWSQDGINGEVPIRKDIWCKIVAHNFLHKIDDLDECILLMLTISLMVKVVGQSQRK